MAVRTWTAREWRSGRLGADTIAVLGARNVEVAPLVAALRAPRRRVLPGLVVWTGRVEGRRTLVAECGSGKVNAALATGWLLFGLGATFVVSVGTCGALLPTINVGDLVVSSRAVIHDYGTRSAVGFRHRGTVGLMIDGQEQRYEKFDGDSRTRQWAVAQLRGHRRVVDGVVASGDTFVSDTDERARIAVVCGAVAVDMTTGGVASTCTAAGVPWLAVRCVSDQADAGASTHYGSHHARAAALAADAVLRLLHHGIARPGARSSCDGGTGGPRQAERSSPTAI